jgi:hypothetical protein
MMRTLPLGLILPLVAGTLLSGLLRPGPGAARLSPLLRICLGVGWAIGTSSCTFYAWLVLRGRPGTAFLATDLALFAGLALAGAALARVRDGPGRREGCPEALPKSVGVILRGALMVSLGVGTALSLLLWRGGPHGSWDAVATWNLRARFLYRGGDSWADAFHPLLLPSHLDYPLLVPTSVARCWAYLGRESLLAPAVLSLVFTLATVGLLVAGLAALRGRTQGVLGGLVLLATSLLFEMSSTQMADIPLAYFLLATVVALALGDQAGGDSRRFPALGGMMAGFAAWTKNEGLLFLAVVLLTRLAVTVRSRGWRVYRREAVAFALGLAPVLAVCVHFKLRFAPPSDFVAGQGPGQIVAKLADLARHAQVVREFAGGIASLGGGLVAGMAVYLLLLGKAPRGASSPGGVFATTVLVLMLAAYHLSYVATPRYLPWHLQWSAVRLILQLWPLGVFAFFLVAATPEEALARTRAGDRRGEGSDEGGPHIP